MHLSLRRPKVFQQSTKPVKYSVGIKGFLGTTFLETERMSLRSMRYFGGGPIKYLIIIKNKANIFCELLTSIFLIIFWEKIF